MAGGPLVKWLYVGQDIDLGGRTRSGVIACPRFMPTMYM